MKGITHGALTAGVNSAFVAGWTRKRACRVYDPNIEPPKMRERVRNRAPMVAAGLGFTGLSTAVAMFFDQIELSLLSDVGDHRPIHQQIENHRELHSLPYLGAGVVAAHLIRHSCKSLAHWISDNLRMPDIVGEIIDELNNLADWVINSGAAGVVEHLLGDVPTQGVGGTALRLLKPITNRNFSLGWVTAAAQPLNQYLTIIGAILSGAAWGITGVYSICWEPPEQRITSYVDEVRQCDSVRAAIRKILSDINQSLSKVLQRSGEVIWNLPLFNRPPENAITSQESLIKTDGLPSQFGLDSFDRETLSDHGILPPELSTNLDVSSIYRKSVQWPDINNTPLVISDPVEYDIPATIFSESTATSFDQSTHSLSSSEEKVTNTKDLW